MRNIDYMAENGPKAIAKGLSRLDKSCKYCAWRGDDCLKAEKAERRCWEGILEWLEQERD